MGPLKLRSWGNRKNLASFSVSMRAPAGLRPAGYERQAAEFVSGGDWLEITLPEWEGIERAAPVAAKAPVGFRTVATMGKGPQPMTGGR